MNKYNFLFGYMIGVIMTHFLLLNSYVSLIAFTFINIVFFAIALMVYLVEEVNQGHYNYDVKEEILRKR